MKNIIWGVVAVVVLVFLFMWGSRSGSSTTESGPVKIGLSLPLTGDLAFIGEADRNAALLALEEINNQQGLKHAYELVIEDDSFDAAKASSVIQKFLSVDNVDAVISIGSTAGNAIAPVAEANELPHIGMASDSVVRYTRRMLQIFALN
jgi:branched-chain amino acid transport system substrate-binding protein